MSFEPITEPRPFVPTDYPLLQWKHAIKLELRLSKLKGRSVRPFRGRSVRRHAALQLGMESTAKPEEVLEAIEERLRMLT